MLSEDYLFRMAAQFGAVFARIMGLKKAGDYQDALQEIDLSLEQLLGLDAGLIRLLDDDSLFRNLTADEQNKNERVKIAADLFKEEGDIWKLQGKKRESGNAYVRALSLYLYLTLNRDPDHPAEVSSTVGEIIQNLEQSVIPSRTLFDLFCHYENEAKYGEAEKVLTELSTRPDAEADAKRELKNYYQRLLENKNMDFSAFGMDREKVQERIKKL